MHGRLYFITLFISIVIFSVSSNLCGYARAVEHPSKFFSFCFICLLWIFCKYSFVMYILSYARVTIFVTELMDSASYALIHLDELGNGNLGLN